MTVRAPEQQRHVQTYLTAATAMLNLAETHRGTLVSKGLTGSALEDLRRMVTEFEAATELARSRRLEHISAREDLDVVTGELMEIVRVLDGINRFRFGKDPEVMAEWNAARHIPVGPRSSRTLTPVLCRLSPLGSPPSQPPPSRSTSPGWTPLC